MSGYNFLKQDLYSPVKFEMLQETKPFKFYPVRWWQKALGGKLLFAISILR